MGKPLIFPGAIKRLKQFMTGKYIEETNIASQNISAGKYVIWKNQMCQAKSAITIGDTLSSANLDTDDEGVANALNSKPKLWGNDEAGTKEFAGQSVEFDTSGFTWFLVEFNNFYAQQDKVCFICKKNEKSRASVVNGLMGEYSGAVSAGMRDFTITSTGATFTAAYSFESSTSAIRNGILTPVAVYGWIK